MANAAREHLKNALRRLRARDAGAAEGELDRAIAVDPRCAEAWQLRGLLRLRAARSRAARAAAVDDLRRAGELDATLWEKCGRALEAAGLWPEAADAYARGGALRALGDVSLRLGRYHEGVAALRGALAREPGSESLRIELAEHLCALGDPAAALEVLTAVTPAAPTTQQARALLELGRFEDARQTLLALAAPEAREMLVRAGAFDDAGALASEAARRDPRDVRPLLLLGRLASWRGRHDDARALAERCLAIDAARGAAWRLRAVARLSTGDDRGAWDDLEEALRLDPGDGEALVWRAELHQRQGRQDEAFADYERGIERQHGYPIGAHAARVLLHLDNPVFPAPLEFEAYRELSALLAPIAPAPPTRERPALAAQFHAALAAMHGNRTPRATYVEGGVLRPFDPPSHSRFLARTLQEKLRVRPADEVLPALAALAAARPGEPTIWCHHGEVALWLGRYDDAEASFRRALEIADNTRWAFVGLAAAELLRGRYDETIAWCERAAEKVVPGRTQYIYRGEAYRRLGDRERALADLARSDELTPGRLSCAINLALLRAEPEGLASAVAALERRAPGLVADAVDEAGGDHAAVLERALAMMRGNRSSTFVTYFTRAGALRFVPDRTYEPSPRGWRHLGF